MSSKTKLFKFLALTAGMALAAQAAWPMAPRSA
jgi:hypothetical protein